VGGGGKEGSRRKLETVAHVRLDDELRQAIAARAEREKIAPRKVSRLYRALLRAGLEGDAFKTWGRALDELTTMHDNLHRIGINLNQVAHHLNAKGQLKDKDLTAALNELRPAVKKCYETLEELKHGIVRRVR
jgi:hypothetical protein